jgi:hypothetical protein
MGEGGGAIPTHTPKINSANEVCDLLKLMAEING